MSEPLFFEEQKFRQRRMIILTAIPPMLMTLLAIWQAGLGNKWGRQPMSNASVIGWAIFLWVVYLRLITVKLVTQLLPGELRIAMRGVWRSARVRLAEVKSVRATTLDAVSEWGGYGIRRSKRGVAYLAGGNQGVELQLRDGSVAVIGSGRAAELARRIEGELGK
ncbi:MAG TPA: hypothetical protein VKS01_12235 [Bryobacteraceae bacterium]|nr:hypothetical protein [Bryobacteraceae bacterium]